MGSKTRWGVFGGISRFTSKNVCAFVLRHCYFIQASENVCSLDASVRFQSIPYAAIVHLGRRNLF